MAIIRTKLFQHFMLTHRCRLSFSHSSLFISHSYFHPTYSTLGNAHDTPPIPKSNAHSHHSNPFADFAATEFNLSSVEIASILKINRSLERLQTLDLVERVVDILRSYGCNRHQIASIMIKFPHLLSFCPEKVIDPKVQLLRDVGIRNENLAGILTRCPRILGRSIQIPALSFLKNIYKTDNLLIKAISKHPLIVTYDLDRDLKPSVAFWEGCGLTGMRLSRLLVARPGLLQCTGLDPVKTDLIQMIGADNGRKTCIHALIMVVVFPTQTLEAQINNFQQLGLTTEETMELFRVSPYVYYFPREKVRRKFDFIVSKVGLPANSVLKVREFLFSSLEKVVKPRLLVLQKMNSLNGDEHALRRIVSIMRMPEATFVSKVIEEHHESTQLNEIYQEALTNAATKSEMIPERNIGSFEV